jgi:hypothetical protein
MLVLFASELSYFLTTEVTPELFVDTSRNEKMRINLDIVFPEMPCASLHAVCVCVCVCVCAGVW